VSRALLEVAVQALAANAGTKNAGDVLCGALEVLRSDLFVAQSALYRIDVGGLEAFEVTLIGLSERIDALRNLTMECLRVEWKQAKGGAS
jgi:hypothetical protein